MSTKLTQEQKRTAIAEACGWRWIVGSDVGEYDHWSHPTLTTTGKHPPDYFGDLNAIHEAEKALTEEQCDTYFGLLCGNEPEQAKCEADGFWFHATAAQRAEAFGRTLNLWP